MPIDRELIESSFHGKVRNQVLVLLSDGNGYRFSEIHSKVKCSKGYLARVISELKSFGNINSKPYSDDEKTSERVVYFIPDEMFKLED